MNWEETARKQNIALYSFTRHRPNQGSNIILNLKAIYTNCTISLYKIKDNKAFRLPLSDQIISKFYLFKDLAHRNNNSKKSIYQCDN